MDLPFPPLSRNDFRPAFVAKKCLAKFRGAELVERRIMGAWSQAASSGAGQEAISEVGGIFDPFGDQGGHQDTSRQEWEQWSS